MTQNLRMREKKSTGLKKFLVKDWRLLVFLLPLFIWFGIFVYKPMLGLLVSFKRYDADLGITNSNWVGFANFATLMTGAKQVVFWHAFRNTFMISFYGLLFGFPMPIILALIFSEINSEGYRKITQTLTYLPHFLSEVTITGIVIIMVSQTNTSTGILAKIITSFNSWLNTLGGNASVPTESLTNYANYFRPIYILTGMWKESGYNSIVYFAAIMGISPVMYEALKVDGGNKWQELRYVTIPGMAPTLIIMLIMRIGKMLSVGFERVYLLYNVNTYVTGDVLSTLEQRIGMNGANPMPGVGAAAGMFNSVIGFALVIGANYISRKASNISLW